MSPGPAPFGHGLVVGKFYPPHRGHHHLIREAARRCRAVTVVVAPSRRESIPLELRVAWLREVHAGEPHVRVVGVYDDHPVDYADPAAWEAHCAVFRAAAGRPADAVFSSEAYGPELARRFGAAHVAVDPGRARFPVSGTAVRADPPGHWHLLEPPVRAWFVRRVVVLGAESTGTTTLARALARRFRRRGGPWALTRWVPEYGRRLTERKLAALRATRPHAAVHDLAWSRADFREVARRQNAAEDAAARRGGPLLVCDTDSLATAVWEERYLGAASAAVRRARRPADLYLLTSHEGVPFHDDGLRDGEQLRPRMTERFAEELRGAGVEWRLLTGPHRARLRAAAAACDALLERGWPLAPPLGPPGAVSECRNPWG